MSAYLFRCGLLFISLIGIFLAPFDIGSCPFEQSLDLIGQLIVIHLARNAVLFEYAPDLIERAEQKRIIEALEHSEFSFGPYSQNVVIEEYLLACIVR